jgi:hypothetical protein
MMPNDYESHRRVTLLQLRQYQLSDAARSLPATLQLAPADSRSLWNQLQTVLSAAQNGGKEQALAGIQELLKSDQAKDQMVQDTLHALSDRLQSAN